jgi:hypothetical protein
VLTKVVVQPIQNRFQTSPWRSFPTVSFNILHTRRFLTFASLPRSRPNPSSIPSMPTTSSHHKGVSHQKELRSQHQQNSLSKPHRRHPQRPEKVIPTHCTPFDIFHALIPHVIRPVLAVPLVRLSDSLALNLMIISIEYQ